MVRNKTSDANVELVVCTPSSTPGTAVVHFTVPAMNSNTLPSSCLMLSILQNYTTSKESRFGARCFLKCHLKRTQTKTHVSSSPCLRWHGPQAHCERRDEPPHRPGRTHRLQSKQTRSTNGSGIRYPNAAIISTRSVVGARTLIDLCSYLRDKQARSNEKTGCIYLWQMIRARKMV